MAAGVSGIHGAGAGVDAGSVDAPTLKQSEKIFNDLGESKSLHAAELFNMKAIVADSEGDLETAIANYQEALLISSSFLGLDHMDIRVVSTSLASAYSQKGDLDVAINAGPPRRKLVSGSCRQMSSSE